MLSSFLMGKEIYISLFMGMKIHIKSLCKRYTKSLFSYKFRAFCEHTFPSYINNFYLRAIYKTEIYCSTTSSGV